MAFTLPPLRCREAAETTLSFLEWLFEVASVGEIDFGSEVELDEVKGLRSWTGYASWVEGAEDGGGMYWCDCCWPLIAALMDAKDPFLGNDEEEEGLV